ncbi:hypothetical protein ABC733_06730 [Mangrovibacter sp. SLW1]
MRNIKGINSMGKLRTKILISRLNMIYRVNNDTNYKDVTICDEWLNDKEAYYHWYLANMIEGWHLDKDILSGESKIYSPETCMFVPNEVNLMFRKKYSNSSLMYKGIMKNGTGYRMKSTFNGKSKNGKTHHTQEEAYVDYLHHRIECFQLLQRKYSNHTKLCEVIKCEIEQCLAEITRIN